MKSRRKEKVTKQPSIVGNEHAEKGMHLRLDTHTAIDFIFVAILFVFASRWAYTEYISSPPYVDPAKYPVRGIDISGHNGMVNMKAAARDGIEFVFIKASEGATFRDENFRLNYEKASDAGLKTGAYHFFRFDVDGVSQAINLLKAVGDRQLDLGVVVDVEKHGNPSDVDPADIQQRLTDMVDHLRMRGLQPTIYTSRSDYYELLEGSFDDLPLWLCHFNGDLAKLDPSLTSRCRFWQFSHSGSVAGLKGDVDLNVFNGSRYEWEQHLKAIKRRGQR